MKTVLVDRQHIADYIPQKHPIVMVDTLDHCEGAVTTTSFEIRPDNLFVKHGELHEPGIIENMAQTAAVKAGYEARQLGMAPLPGFIGAIKNLQIYALPKTGDVLETTVTVKTEVMDVTLIESSVYCGSIKIAECEMKIVLQKPQ